MEVDNLVFTDDSAEMEALGKQFYDSRKDIYTQKMTESIFQTIEKYIPNADEMEKKKIFFRSIYDYWMYGVNVNEEFYLHFTDMKHETKLSYLTYRNRFLYYHHLNNKQDEHILNDKYESYLTLKDFYQREVILLDGEDDYPQFEDFVRNHASFVVKPLSMAWGQGVHKVNTSDYKDTRTLFNVLIKEGLELGNTGQPSALVLEEIINQHEEMSRLHPWSVNGVRCTTIRVKDKVHIFHPHLKLGAYKHFVTSSTSGTLDACIDPETGIVITLGKTKRGESFRYHPTTGVEIPGFRIPEWNALIDTATKLSDALPQIRYVGWDLVLTNNGWVAMEGNFTGNFTSQFILEKGLKYELEELIGWKPKQLVWWE